jgi:hypothetical protein
MATQKMILRNILDHKRNTKVMVEGVTYKLDGQGIIRDVHPDHARKLLQNSRVWTVIAERESAKAVPAAKEAPKAAEKTEDEPTGAPASVPAPPPIGEPAGELPTEPSEPADDEGEGDPEAVTVAPGVIPGEGEQWPDPTEDMDINYLRAMADAYHVEYGTKTSRKVLVNHIKKAMYD